MKNKNNRITRTDDQMALEYAIYMIAGSYFAGTTCTNTPWERKLRAAYWGMKPENQYRIEELCELYMEKNLADRLPENFRTEHVRVRMIPCRRLSQTELRFEGRDFILRMRGEYRGRKSRIRGQIWKRKEAACGPV